MTSPPDLAARLDAESALLRSRITGMDEDLVALLEASRNSNADDEHDPEGQTIAYERAQLSALIRQARDSLEEVEAARGRMVAGTYGVCEVCGQPVPPGRLEARPTARTCLRHA